MDIKRKLRELEPFNAAENALKEIDNLLGESWNIQKKSLTLELLSEFVFFEKPNQHQVVSRHDELLILQTICSYFGSESNTGRHDLFAIMFNKDTIKNQKSFCYKLIMMAVLLHVIDILQATGVFMNQLGNLAPESIGICEMIIHELFVNYPICYEYLEPLSSLSAVFTSNFITGVCNIYFNRKSTELKIPSIKLLEIMGKWLVQDVSVSFANKDLLKNSKNAKNELALVGLIRWSVLAPLYQLHVSSAETQPNESLLLQIHLHVLLGIQSIATDDVHEAVRVHVNVFVAVVDEMRFVIEAANLKGDDSVLMTSYVRLTQILVNLKKKQMLDGDLSFLSVSLKHLPGNVYMTSLLEEF